MSRIATSMLAVVLTTWSVGLMGMSAHADMILEQYEFQGQAGTETSLASSFTATGINSVVFGESSVTPSAASNSISSSGWNNSAAFYSFGFNVAAGQVATVSQLVFSSRSSGTGPGFLNVQASVDGGAFTTVGSFTQTSTNFNDQMLAINSVSAAKSLIFHIVAANQTSASGATIGSTGTFRIGDYNPSGTPTPFTLNGTIAPAAVASVPEPSAFVLTSMGLITAGVITRTRRRQHA